MLNKVKIMLGITGSDKDELLTLLIEKAEDYCLNYTHRDNSKGLEQIIIDMVCFDYNRLGTQGVDSESYSGVSFNYSADYPETLLRALRAKRKVVVV